MRDAFADFGCELAEFNSEANHAPLLVNFPPTVALSSLLSAFTTGLKAGALADIQVAVCGSGPRGAGNEALTG